MQLDGMKCRKMLRSSSASPPRQAKVCVGELARLLPVSVIGRIFNIEAKRDCSITAIQSALQHHLQLEDQMFHLFNCNGKLLLTDLQVQEAVIEHLTPLYATPIDSPTACIESKHEALAHMQSAFPKENVKGTTGKISTCKQGNELQHHPEIRKKDRQMLTDRAHDETLRMLVNDHDTWKAELNQLSERVNAVAQVVNSERNQRELSLLSVNKRVQDVHNLFESECSTREQQLSKYLALIQNLMRSIVDVKHSKETLEDKYAAEIHALNERVDTISGHCAEMLQDQLHSFRDSVEEITVSFEQQSRQIQQIRSQEQTNVEDLTSCFTELEEHCLAIESSFTDAASLLAAGIDQLIKRYDSLSELVQNLEDDMYYHNGKQSVEETVAGSAQEDGRMVQDIEATFATITDESVQTMHDDRLEAFFDGQKHQMIDLGHNFCEHQWKQNQPTGRAQKVCEGVTNKEVSVLSDSDKDAVRKITVVPIHKERNFSRSIAPEPPSSPNFTKLVQLSAPQVTSIDANHVVWSSEGGRLGSGELTAGNRVRKQGTCCM